MIRKSKLSSFLVVILLLLLVGSACSNSGGENETPDEENQSGNNETTSTNSNNSNNSSNSTEENATNESSEPVTLTYMIDADSSRPIDGTKPVTAEFGNRVNVKLEFENITGENYVQKLTSFLVGDNLTDIVTFPPSTKFLYDEYSNRFLVPLDEYINDGKMPNLQKWIEKYPEFKNIMTNPDGHIYGAPVINAAQNVTSVMHVRADILKKQGINPEDVRTLDDYYEAFRAIKREDPDMFWVHRSGWNYMGRAFLPIFGAAQTVWYDAENQTYKMSALTENYKIAIKFLADMYEEKILHPDFLVKSDQSYRTELRNFKGGMMADSIYENMEGYRLKDTDPVIEEAQLLPPIINGKQIKLSPTPNIALDRITSISKSSPNIDAAIKLLDYGYSEEGVELLWYGREGIDWKEDSTQPNGKFLLTRGQFNLLPDGTPDQSFPTNQDLGLIGYGVFYVWPPEGIHGTYYLPKEEAERASRIPNINKYFQENNAVGVSLPQVVFNEDELDVLKNVGTPLFTMIDEYATKFILGQLDFSEWDNFVAEVKKAGAEQVEDAYNSALERYNSM